MESEAMTNKQASGGRIERTVSGVQSGAVNVLGVTGAVVFATSIILCAIVVPILMIVIGARNHDKCPAEDLIPVYLIVAGTLALILVPISAMVGFCLKSVSKETGGGACFHFLMALFFTAMGVFSFIWFICGNVWVFREYEPSYNAVTDPDNYCDELTYKFAFWVIIATYVCSILSCCCSCCFQRQSTYEGLN